MSLELLCELEIPLPNVEKQQEIVNNWLALKAQERALKTTILTFKNNLSDSILLKI